MNAKSAILGFLAFVATMPPCLAGASPAGDELDLRPVAEVLDDSDWARIIEIVFENDPSLDRPGLREEWYEPPAKARSAAAHADLNADGENELIVQFQFGGYCAQVGCMTFVLIQRAGTLRLLVEHMGYHIRIVPNPPQPYATIESEVYSLEWNGDHYVQRCTNPQNC